MPKKPTQKKRKQGKPSRASRNKIENERLKLSATLLNALAIASIFTAFFKPLIDREIVALILDPFLWIWIVIGLILHLGARYLLTYLRDEN